MPPAAIERASEVEQYDVFVSYAHGAEGDPDAEAPLRTWSHALVKYLERLITDSLGDKSRPVKIWYDTKLAKNDYLTDALRRQIEACPILLIIMSRPYLNSEWCNKEREWFEAEIRRRGGDIRSVFVVRAMQTDQQKWQGILKDRYGDVVMGYPFCAEHDRTQEWPFGWWDPEKSVSKGKFMEASSQLASDMAKEISRQREVSDVAPEPDAPKAPEPSPHTVLLAPSTPDVQGFRDKVRNALIARGIDRLLPDNRTSIDNLSTAEMATLCQQVQAFVQVLGAVDAPDARDTIGNVRKLAARAEQERLHRFFWRWPQIDPAALIANQDYLNFVKAVPNPYGDPEELAEAVLRHLATIGTGPAPSSEIVAFTELPFSAHDQFDDWQQDILAQDCFLLPPKPPSARPIGDMQRERRALTDFLAQCQLVLLLYCQSGLQGWLRDNIIFFAKSRSQILRQGGRAPAVLVIDYVNEAEATASAMNIDVFAKQRGSDPQELWDRIRTRISWQGAA